MLKFLLQGFLLGIAYAAPIGMQNMYVINTAVNMSRLRAYQVALITTFFDISLALACFFGIGIILENAPFLKGIVLFIGTAAIIYIGIGLIRSIPTVSSEMNLNQPLYKVAAICFAVTWLNPQAIIDGTMLFGGFRATLPGNASKFFILGSSLASFAWFTFISTIMSVFKSIISPKILRLINIVCGTVLIIYGLRLGYSLIKIL